MGSPRCRAPQPRPVIFIADSDEENNAKKLRAKEGDAFKSHGNGVYSLVLPNPSFRNSEQGICIEEMYTDTVVCTEIDSPKGHRARLYLTDEFDQFGFHMRDSNLVCLKLYKRNLKSSRVLDGNSFEVIRSMGNERQKIPVLTKNDFATYMLEHATEFDDDRFETFIPVFSSIQQAIQDWGNSHNGKTAKAEPAANTPTLPPVCNR